MNFKRVLTIVITALAVGMIALSGVMKLLGNPGSSQQLEAMGVGAYRVWLGLAEVIIALLFAYPGTVKIGFILAASYFAGAVATELSHHAPLYALTPLVISWLSAGLRDKSIFLPSTNG